MQGSMHFVGINCYHYYDSQFTEHVQEVPLGGAGRGGVCWRGGLSVKPGFKQPLKGTRDHARKPTHVSPERKAGWKGT